MCTRKTPEGMCSFRIDSDRWYSSCRLLESLEHVSGDTTSAARQFFLANCTDGQKGWIEVDENLFNDLRIDRGLIKGYGVVAAE